MSFKTKNKKKVHSDNRVTLDAKHNQKIDYFNNLKQNLETLKKDLKKKKKNLF